ncbi:hypothetical protein I4U23_031455 [Adineta vaga]|nr:hypothetical protein I4U23_031455 [Adineta vaga]
MAESDFDIQQELCEFVRDGRLIEFDQYLYILSDQSNLLTTIIQQGDERFSLLMLAAVHGHEEIVRMILICSPTSIELEGSMYDSEGGLIGHVTALWCALDRGHFTIAHTLIDLGAADVNHGPLYPLLIDASTKGRLDIVQFLVDNGHADVNRTLTNDGDKCNSLVLAARSGQENIVAYLLDKGVDTNYRTHVHQDTALTVAASEGHSIIIQMLCAAGASVTVKNLDGKTPMTLVAERQAFEAIDSLFEYIHDETTFNDLELVASSYLANSNPITLDERQRMVRLLRKSLEQRILFHSPKPETEPIVAYDFQRECQTIDELDQIQTDHDRLCIEALLICERILVVRKDMRLFHQLFERRILMLVENEQFDRSFQLALHLFHLQRQMNVQNSVQHFIWIFCRMITTQTPIPAEQFLFPNVDTTRLLLAYGQRWIDVNARSQTSNETALHIVCRNINNDMKGNVLKIIEMLLDVGAHIDYVDSHGQTALNIATDTDIRTLLKSKQKISRLKCLCARFITMHQIPYDHVWPKSTPLTSFVQLHYTILPEEDIGFGLFD